jgi:hypothetical protein
MEKFVPVLLMEVDCHFQVRHVCTCVALLLRVEMDIIHYFDCHWKEGKAADYFFPDFLFHELGARMTCRCVPPKESPVTNVIYSRLMYLLIGP